MLAPPEEMDNPTETQQVRSSSRERNLTEKGQELKKQELKKKEKAFNKAYETWRLAAKEIRAKLKTFCSPEELEGIQRNIKAKHDKVCQHYEPIRLNHTSTPGVVKKMDACSTLSSEICDIVNKRMENIDKAFNDCLEKERVRMQLNKEEYGSVFGRTNTETVVSQSLEEPDDQVSNISMSSSKRADAEAELAAKVEQAKAVQMLHAQQAKLEKLETEWKLRETQMLVEIKEREAEMKLKLEEEKSKLQQLKAESEVKVAEARVRAYNSFEVETDKTPLDSPNTEYRHFLNPQATPFEPRHAAPLKSTPEDASVAQETVLDRKSVV